MDRTTIRSVLAVLGTSLILSACQQVSEPWDNTAYFEKERTRTAEQEKRLRQRLAHTQGYYQEGMHETAPR